jgi:hypothetical protein
MKTRNLALTGLAVLVLAGAGVFAAGLVARREVVRHVEATLAQPPFREASHGAIRYSLWRRRLEIDDLAVKTDLAALQSARAAEVTVDGLGPALLFGGDLALDEIRAQQVEATAGLLKASTASLTLDEVRVKGGLSPEPANSGKEAVAALLARLSVGRLALGTVHLASDAAPLDLTLDAVSAEGIANGRIAGLTATKGEAHLGSGDGKLQLALARLELSGVDAVALGWVLAPQTAPGDGPVAIAQAIKLDSLAIADDRGTLNAASLSLSGLRLRPDATPAQDPPAALGRLLGGAAFDHLELGSLAIRPSAAAGRSATLAHLAIDKLKPGSIGALRLDGLALDAADGFAHLDSAETSGLAFGREALPIGFPALFADKIQIRNLSLGAKPGAAVTVKDATIVMEGSLADPRGAEIKAGPIGVPAAAAPALAKLGYDALSLAYEGTTRYDPAAESLSISQHISAEGAGALALSMRLDHYPAALDAPSPAAASLLLTQAQLAHLELRYDDASLVERLLKLYAASTGRDLASAQREIAARIEARRKGFAGKPAMLASLDRVEAFLRKPDTITLVLAPPKPLPLLALMLLGRADPDQALDALGLSVR